RRPRQLFRVAGGAAGGEAHALPAGPWRRDCGWAGHGAGAAGASADAQPADSRRGWRGRAYAFRADSGDLSAASRPPCAGGATDPAVACGISGGTRRVEGAIRAFRAAHPAPYLVALRERGAARLLDQRGPVALENGHGVVQIVEECVGDASVDAEIVDKIAHGSGAKVDPRAARVGLDHEDDLALTPDQAGVQGIEQANALIGD